MKEPYIFFIYTVHWKNHSTAVTVQCDSLAKGEPGCMGRSS